jgi:hypothetical protein
MTGLLSPTYDMVCSARTDACRCIRMQPTFISDDAAATLQVARLVSPQEGPWMCGGSQHDVRCVTTSGGRNGVIKPRNVEVGYATLTVKLKVVGREGSSTNVFIQGEGDADHLVEEKPLTDWRNQVESTSILVVRLQRRRRAGGAFQLIRQPHPKLRPASMRHPSRSNLIRESSPGSSERIKCPSGDAFGDRVYPTAPDGSSPA